MNLTADELNLIRDTLGDEAVRMINDPGMPHGPRRSLSSLTIEELTSVHRGCGIGVAMAMTDMQRLLTKQASVMAEIRQRNESGAFGKVAPQRKRPAGRMGKPPYGYRHGEGGLEPEGAEQAVIATIREMRSGGATIQAIADALNERGIAPRQSERWSTNTVWCIVNRAKREAGAA
jgi:hypothetical protein